MQKNESFCLESRHFIILQFFLNFLVRAIATYIQIEKIFVFFLFQTTTRAYIMAAMETKTLQQIYDNFKNIHCLYFKKI